LQINVSRTATFTWRNGNHAPDPDLAILTILVPPSVDSAQEKCGLLPIVGRAFDSG
jgi:hypothetical protein